MQIRDSVHLVMVSVTWTPPVLRLQLTCVTATRPAATGVNVIKDTPEMDSPVPLRRSLQPESWKMVGDKNNALFTKIVGRGGGAK